MMCYTVILFGTYNVRKDCWTVNAIAVSSPRNNAVTASKMEEKEKEML